MSAEKHAAPAHRQDTGLLRGYLGEAGRYVPGSPASEILLGELARQPPSAATTYRGSATPVKRHT